jgi:DNA ligase 1
MNQTCLWPTGNLEVFDNFIKGKRVKGERQMREYVMLAKKWSGENVAGFYMSEKYDGMRALWDGLGPEYDGPRPWARVSEGATGLWSRYGNVIHAPEWWLDGLPRNVIFDGELLARGNGEAGESWRESVSVCRSHDAGNKWEGIVFNVFDAPLSYIFGKSDIVRGGACKDFKIYNFSGVEGEGVLEQRVNGLCYAEVYEELLKLEEVEGADQWCVVEQEKVERVDDVYDFADRISKEGGEGVMLRAPGLWVPKRCEGLLKVKKVDLGRGVVTGYTGGEGKYKGLVGALCVKGIGDLEGVEFKLSGMTDKERHKPPVIGAVVEYKHSGLTHNGVPREARYTGTVEPPA